MRGRMSMMLSESIGNMVQLWAVNVLFWATVVLLLVLSCDFVLAFFRKTLWRSTIWNLCWVFLLLLPFAGWMTPKVFVFVDNTDSTNVILNHQVGVLDSEHGQQNPVADSTSTSISEAKSGFSGLPGENVEASATENMAESRTSVYAMSMSSALVCVYLCGLGWMAFSLFSGLLITQRLSRSAKQLTDRTWNKSFSCALVRLGLDPTVKLATTDDTSIPLVIGIWKPVVLVPSSLIKTLTEKESYAVVVHELTHIKRCDQWWNLLYHLSRALFWFHPLLWVAGPRSSQSRESSCDDYCVHVLGSARDYGEALLKVASSQLIPSVQMGVSFVSHSKIGARINFISRSEGNMLCHSRRLTGLMMATNMSIVVTLLTSLSIFNSSPGMQSESNQRSEAARQLESQEFAENGPDQILSGSIQLLSRSKYDYEKATFSFEHGVRDDPGHRVTRNEWELQFGNGSDSFTVNTMLDDRSSIFDLGQFDFSELREIPEQIWEREDAARAKKAVSGHMYIVHTQDSESNHMSLFRVVGLVPGESCTLEWVHERSRPPKRLQKQEQLEMSDATKTKLAKLLRLAKNAQRKIAGKRMGFLSGESDIVLQMKTGARGGNPTIANIAGNSLAYSAERKSAALDFSQPPNIDDDAYYFVKGGGVVPDGKVFLIHAIDIYAHAVGDSNGKGEAIFRVGDRELVHVNENEDDYEKRQEPVRMWFEGLFILRPNQEDEVNIELANSSAIDVRIKGKLVDSKLAKDAKQIPFKPGKAPDGIKRAGYDLLK